MTITQKYQNMNMGYKSKRRRRQNKTRGKE